jgi:hypothetical protein
MPLDPCCLLDRINSERKVTVSIPIPDLRKVWHRKNDEFNEWRATNDLPQLLAFFKIRFPGFADWLTCLSLGADFRRTPTAAPPPQSEFAVPKLKEAGRWI